MSESNLNVKEIAAALGIGMTKAYELVNQPGFPSFRIGRKILASAEDLRTWQHKQIEVNERFRKTIAKGDETR